MHREHAYNEQQIRKQQQTDDNYEICHFGNPIRKKKSVDGHNNRREIPKESVSLKTAPQKLSNLKNRKENKYLGKN